VALYTITCKLVYSLLYILQKETNLCCSKIIYKVYSGFSLLFILTGQMTISAGIFDQISSYLYPNTLLKVHFNRPCTCMCILYTMYSTCVSNTHFFTLIKKYITIYKIFYSFVNLHQFSICTFNVWGFKYLW
jgi:hypothetical protein